MKTIRRILALLLAALMASGCCLCASASGSVSTETCKTAAYLAAAVREPTVGSIGGEWAVLALARAGCAVPDGYFDGYYARVEQYVKRCSGVLHERKYTEYSRVVLALTAIGRDPTRVGRYDLLAPLGDFERTILQGVNGPIFALLALDSGSYAVPQNPNAKTQATRQLYVDEILKRQLADGGWALSGSGSADPDLTAMALQALAKYQGQKKVSSAIRRALTCLSGLQNRDGGYSSWGTANSGSVAQVIIALCELGISLDDSRFVKNGHGLVENLLSFRQSNGGFYHVTDGSSGSDQMSTEQGLCALAAICRVEGGQSSLYRMEDSASGSTVKKADPDPAVSVPAVTRPGTTFSDVQGHANRTAIEALAGRGIINGIGAGKFQPDSSMTRAEFAAIVTRALGLPTKSTRAFRDVPATKWYAGFVSTASSYSIINGIGGGLFAPDSTITRQEAAAMVARAAKLCGLDASMSSADIQATLAQFGDRQSIAAWAEEPLAFCYAAGILDPGAPNVQPNRPILRCEIAQMLYNLLLAAELI